MHADRGDLEALTGYLGTLADDPAVRVIIVEPDDAENWKGPNRLIAGAKLLTAAVTGAKVDFGESKKVGHL